VKVIGLAGPARSGKNTVADILVAERGFVRFAFSDALYEEVAQAFNVSQAFLRGSSTKEVPHHKLRLCAPLNQVFTAVVRYYHPEVSVLQPLSPRQVLQWWGTEYRRTEHPNYWVDRLRARIADLTMSTFGPLRVVVDGVRYANEVHFIHEYNDGELWLINRPGAEPVAEHSSEKLFHAWSYDQTITNDGTIEELKAKVLKACPSEPPVDLSLSAQQKCK